jgi:hypothetical protein
MSTEIAQSLLLSIGFAVSFAVSFSRMTGPEKLK